MGEEERVEYSYTGDVSSLRNATREAISLLGKYESVTKNLATSGNLNVGKTAFTGFQRTVNGVIKQVNTLSNYMSTASAESQRALVPDTSAITSAYQNISDAFDWLQSGSKITTDDMKLLTQVLQETRATLDPIATKAQVLGSSFTNVAQMTGQAMTQVNSSVSTTASSVSTTVDTLGQKWDDYANRMSKSAEMSAQVFAQAGEFTGFTTGVDTAVAKIVLARQRIDDTIASMTNRLKSMSSAFDPVTAKIESYKAKATSSLGLVRKALDSVSAAFRRTTQSTNSSDGAASRSAATHRGLAAAIQKLNSSVTTEQKSLKGEQKTLESKNRELKNSSKNHSGLSGIIGKLGRMFSSETGSAKSFGESLKSTTRHAGLLHQALQRLTLVQIGRWLASAVKQSIAYIENLNLFTVAMGDSVEKGLEFVDTMSEIYGMDPSNLYRYAGYFYQLTDAIGMAEEASSVLSLSLTKASNDIASLFNVDVETVVENLASGMQGMSRAVRKYGMDIRATTLQQTALNYGITDQVESMSEANRMALRYLTMMEQVKNATSQVVEEVDGSTKVIGDFAKTIETPANQLRIFKEQVTQLGRAIGNFLVPALKAVLPWINGIVMALRTALTVFATMLGFTESLTDDISSSSSAVKDLGTSVKATTKDIKNMLAPFDELNVLSDQTSDTAGIDDVLDPALQEAIENMSLTLDNVRMKANEIRDTILEFFGFKTVDVFNPDTGEWESTLKWFSESFQKNLVDKFPQWEDTINSVFENLPGIIRSFGRILSALIDLVDTLISKFSEFLQISGFDAVIASGIESYAKALEYFATILSTAIAGLDTGLDPLLEKFSTFLQFFSSIVQPILAAIANLFSDIWSSIQTLWSENMVPLLEQTDEVLASVMSTLGSLWQNISVIVADAINLIDGVWNSSMEPFYKALLNALRSIMEVIQTLWDTVLGPVIEYIGDGLQHLWTQYLSPIISDILEIVIGLGELILNLWNTVLQPLVNFIVNLFGPPIAAVFQGIWTVVETAVAIIGSAISILTGALSGVIEFLNGVFTGDWKRALSGIANIFVSLGNGILGVIESVCNLGVGAINAFLSFIVGGVKGIVNALGGLIEDIASFLGYELDLSVDWTIPQLDRVTIQRIPKVDLSGSSSSSSSSSGGGGTGGNSVGAGKLSSTYMSALAAGGVVTSPTQVLIGEGRYDEAVIPLNNSPQMRELVDEIADATSSNDTVQVNVYIGNEQVAEYYQKAERRRQLQTNGGI